MTDLSVGNQVRTRGHEFLRVYGEGSEQMAGFALFMYPMLVLIVGGVCLVTGLDEGWQYVPKTLKEFGVPASVAFLAFKDGIPIALGALAAAVWEKPPVNE